MILFSEQVLVCLHVVASRASNIFIHATAALRSVASLDIVGQLQNALGICCCRLYQWAMVCALSILFVICCSCVSNKAEAQSIKLDYVWRSRIMNRRQQLQHDLQQLVESRHQLSQVYTAASRVRSHRGVAALRVQRKRKWLVLLRFVMEIGGLSPVAMLTA